MKDSLWTTYTTPTKEDGLLFLNSIKDMLETIKPPKQPVLMCKQCYCVYLDTLSVHHEEKFMLEDGRMAIPVESKCRWCGNEFETLILIDCQKINIPIITEINYAQ